MPLRSISQARSKAKRKLGRSNELSNFLAGPSRFGLKGVHKARKRRGPRKAGQRKLASRRIGYRR
jgi:hypothetical protein